MDDDIPYLLLTPGPLTTSRTVRQAMLRDWCTWDKDYNDLVTDIRHRLLAVAGLEADYTSVLMQGSGTFSVEATIGSVIPPGGKLLTVDNGAYGQRIGQIARRLKIDCTVLEHRETEPASLTRIEAALKTDPAITHVALVHCETTTGMINPAAEVGALCRRYGKIYILDAMSSFGGIPIDLREWGVHFLVSSSNKCLQGVPGFGFVIAKRDHLEQTAGYARSLALDLYDQWKTMVSSGGKWRYTSPTHVVRAFHQALIEFEQEGGVTARHARFSNSQSILVEGMAKLGIAALLPREMQSPIITAFLYPPGGKFTFEKFYQAMKRRRYVLYPGKISQADTFRIGTIGHVFENDIKDLIRCAGEALAEL